MTITTKLALTPAELAMIGNTDVLGHIQAKNAARNAQAEAEGWDFWTLICDTVAERYANVYEMELCFARSEYAEWHKDLYYSKRGPHESMTLEEVRAACDRMARAAKEQWEAEAAEMELIEQRDREEVALGLRPNGGYELEAWEVWEAAAEELGYGA